MKILLVRLRLVGDVVFTTPVIRAVRRRYPDAELTYVVEPSAAAVVRANPHLDEVIVVPTVKGLARLRSDAALAWRLRRRAYDLAIDMHGGPRAAWLTWASGAPSRIGYRIKGRSWMYTTVVDRSPDLAPRHSVVNQWDLLRTLGVGECDPGRDAVEMAEEPRAAAAVEDRLAGAAIDATHPLVLIHVSAGNLFRRWPAEAFEDLSLQGLRALTERAALFIGGDSGPMHIAATTTVPIVALYGPTLPARSEPWRPGPDRTVAMEIHGLPCRPCDQRVCAPGDYRCLGQISPAAVIEAAARLMATTTPT